MMMRKRTATVFSLPTVFTLLTVFDSIIDDSEIDHEDDRDDDDDDDENADNEDDDRELFSFCIENDGSFKWGFSTR